MLNLGKILVADGTSRALCANAWWSVSAWAGRDPMRAFVGNQPHLTIKERLDHYCDEATFVGWEQDSADLPDWQTSYQHLIADGRVASLTHPSDANQTRVFPPPVEAPASH
jgi:hypothetical protein